MRTWAKGTSRAAVLAAGFVALGVSAIPANAYADITDGTGSVLGGNQVDAPISAPVDVSGNGASLLGTTHAASKGGAKVHKRGDGGGRTTSGTDGVASGNQVNAPVSAPVNVCGNGAAVLGHADAGCEGGAKVKDGGTSGQVTDGTSGVLAGNQVNAPISIPVNACGNAVAVAGDAVAGCEGGSLVKNGGRTGSGQETSGLFGVGSGNQANLPISVPVDVCGNAVGDAAAYCEGGASVRNGGHRTGEQITSGAFGVISGNQANAPISIPLTVCGNAAAIVGEAGAFCEGGAHVRSSSGGDQYTSGVGGVLAGNQGNAPVTAPADVCGNAAAVIGFATALCEGGPAHDDPYPHHRAADAGQPLPLAPAPLGKGAATLPKTPSILPTTDDVPATNVLSAVNGLDGVGSAKSQREAGTVPGAEGAPVAVSLLDTQNLPGESILPEVEGQRAASGVPVRGGLVETPGVPTADGLLKRGELLKANGLPKADGLVRGELRKVEGLPATGGQSAVHALSEVDGLSPVTAGLQRIGSMAPLNTKVLPGADGVSDPSGKAGTGSRQADETPKTSLPVPGKIPGVPGGDVLPAKPVVPPLKTVTRGLPNTTGVVDGGPVSEVVPVTGGLGPVERVAAQETITDDAKTGSVWTLAVSGLLAVTAGALALARRIRLGRR